MEFNAARTIEQLKQIKIATMESEATYLLLKKMNPDLKSTKAYFYFVKYGKRHRRVFYYYLSRELGVPDNLGFRRFLDEVNND